MVTKEENRKGTRKTRSEKGKPQEEENRSNNNVLYGNQSA
jgi:hypothetical protein